MSISEEAIRIITKQPGLSAVQIASRMKRKPGSVSSALVHLVRDDVLSRAEKKGPRGGYVYYLSPRYLRLLDEREPNTSKTHWERLMDED